MATAAKAAKSFMATVEGAEVEFFPVDSTRMAARGYNAATKTIYVRFPDGRQYKYPVPADSVWKDFLRSKSAGSFLHTQLGKTPYSQVEDWK